MPPTPINSFRSLFCLFVRASIHPSIYLSINVHIYIHIYIRCNEMMSNVPITPNTLSLKVKVYMYMHTCMHTYIPHTSKGLGNSSPHWHGEDAGGREGVWMREPAVQAQVTTCSTTIETILALLRQSFALLRQDFALWRITGRNPFQLLVVNVVSYPVHHTAEKLLTCFLYPPTPSHGYILAVVVLIRR